MNYLVRNLLIWLILTGCCTCDRAQPDNKDSSLDDTAMTTDATKPISFDWQGHRGCRGLMPENTIPAFLRALSYPSVSTLELDVVISKDNVVIVSHEPWLSTEICQHQNGEKLEEEKISLYGLTAAEIATYDCGILPHPRFPEQANRPGTKPTLLAVFAAVDEYCRDHDRPSPRYNIELKYAPELEPTYVPGREAFVALVLQDLKQWGRPDLVTLQCFDPPTLNVIRNQNPDITLAYLDEFPGDIQKKMTDLGFTPPIYSPYEIHVDKALMDEAERAGMGVIPWTVNETTRMEALMKLGVNGIITDYPDRIPKR